MGAAVIAPFGTLPDGRAVHVAHLEGGRLRVAILTLGAILSDVRMAGLDRPLMLGSPDIAAYAGAMSHFGAIMGPVANRISGAEAVIDGEMFGFEANQDGRHTRHAGAAGVHHKIWEIADHGEDHVTLTCDLPDGEGGFPGTRRIAASYRLTGDSTLELVLEAMTDRPTLMNLANHAYWVPGETLGWEGHSLQIHADRYLPTTAENLPDGRILDVDGTAYDFRAPAVLDSRTPKLDTNFCLADTRRPLTPAVTLTGPDGVTLHMSTTEPGVQIFDMGTIDCGDLATRHGRAYRPRSALAIEPQFWPDAPGRDGWPDITLRPGDDWRQVTTWRFAAA